MIGFAGVSVGMLVFIELIMRTGTVHCFVGRNRARVRTGNAAAFLSIGRERLTGPGQKCHCLFQSRSMNTEIANEDFAKFLLSRNEHGRLQVLPRILSETDMKPIIIDFENLLDERRGNTNSETVCAAVGPCSGLIVDFTAGLGRDSLILATGTNSTSVIMLERNRLLYTLLEDARKCFAATNPVLAAKLSIHNVDSSDITAVSKILEGLQVSQGVTAYLDPMYPPNLVGKRASVKKETQVLQHIVADISLNVKKSDMTLSEIDHDMHIYETLLSLQLSNEHPVMAGVNDADTLSLFASAWRTATTRVVVKRPLSSQPIYHVKPHSIVKGSRQRFDVYFKNRKLL
jgi:hypothetical protein